MVGKKVLGDEHKDTLLNADNVSDYLSRRARHEAAELVRRQTLMARRKKRGDEHPDTLLNANRLGFYLKLGRHEEPDVLGRQTLMIQRVLGHEHPYPSQC